MGGIDWEGSVAMSIYALTVSMLYISAEVKYTCSLHKYPHHQVFGSLILLPSHVRYISRIFLPLC